MRCRTHKILPPVTRSYVVGVCIWWFTGISGAETGDMDLSLEPFNEHEWVQLHHGAPVMRVWYDQALNLYGSIIIASPVTVIWDLMLDCKTNLRMVKDMRSCKILEQGADGSWDIRHQTMRVSVLLPKLNSVFRSEYIPYKRIVITKAGGDMKVQHGFWLLEPLEENVTQMIYRVRIHPDLPIPLSFLKRAARKDLSDILISLQTLAQDQYKTLQHSQLMSQQE